MTENFDDNRNARILLKFLRPDTLLVFKLERFPEENPNILQIA